MLISITLWSKYSVLEAMLKVSHGTNMWSKLGYWRENTH
jgi:hypothetical protein